MKRTIKQTVKKSMTPILAGALLFAVACGGSDQQAETIPVSPAPVQAETHDHSGDDVDPHTHKDDTHTTTDAKPKPAVPTPMPTSDSEVVYFEFDSAALTTEGKTELADEIAWLKAHPRRHIVLHGYTDDVGTPSYNLTLGNARANAVRTYMASEGIDLVRMHVVSHGESGPELPDEDERRAMFVGTIKVKK